MQAKSREEQCEAARRGRESNDVDDDDMVHFVFQAGGWVEARNEAEAGVPFGDCVKSKQIKEGGESGL